MFPHSSDPIVNVYYGQIKRSIEICLENQCLDAAVKLIYSGIDTMAFLGMPVKQQDVIGQDFINWVDQYIQFPCKEQVTGGDLYGARCGMLHTHSVYSRLSREGKCRLVGYMDKSVPEVRYRPEINKDLVMVSIPALAEAFFTGVDKYLIDIFSNTDKAKIAEQRLKELVHTLLRKE
jgi:hypothetical protein